MALNINDKYGILNQLLPEVEFTITSTGVTVLPCSRLSLARFVPFDSPGRCRECKSAEVDLDFAVVKEGVYVYCSRMKGQRFVPFDTVYELPGHCFFKIRNKGRVFHINHGQRELPQCQQQSMVPQYYPTDVTPIIVPSAPQPQQLTTFEAPPQIDASALEAKKFLDKLSVATAPLEYALGAKDQQQEQLQSAQKFMDKLAAATAPLEFALNAKKSRQSQQKQHQQQPTIQPKQPTIDEETMFLSDEEFRTFFGRMDAAAATKDAPSQADTLRSLKRHSAQMEEEEAAAINLTKEMEEKRLKTVAPPPKKQYQRKQPQHQEGESISTTTITNPDISIQ